MEQERLSCFCCEENFLQRLEYLDQELGIFGYPSFVKTTDNNCGNSFQPSKLPFNHVLMTNVMYDLMQRWRATSDDCKDTEELNRKTEAELTRLKHLLLRLKNDIADRDQQLTAKEFLCKQYNQRISVLEKKLKHSQDKNKKLMSDLTSRDSQFRHDKKKKMQEIEKLQTRLQQLLQDKRHERMLGIEMLNSLQRADGKRGKWITDKSKKSNEHEMYRLVLTNYEEAQKKLLKENEDMRGYLKNMQNELITALNDNEGGKKFNSFSFSDNSKKDFCGISQSSSSSSLTSDLSEGVFEMPYDLVKDDIEKSIRGKWNSLRKELYRKASTADQPDGSTNAEEYERVIKEQQQLIEYLTSGKGEERSIPDECLYLEEKAVFEKEKNLFEQQKKAFDKERKLYAEALIHLDAERHGFEAEKHEWLQNKFLALTPFKPNISASSFTYFTEPESNRRNNSSRSFHENSTVLNSELDNHIQKNTLSNLHSSGYHSSSNNFNRTSSKDSFSNNYSAKSTVNSQYEPTTADLYKTLGLVYHGKDNSTREYSPRESGKKEKRRTPSNQDHKHNIKEFHHLVRSNLQRSRSPYYNSENLSDENPNTTSDHLSVSSGRFIDTTPRALKRARHHLRSRSAPKDIHYFETHKSNNKKYAQSGKKYLPYDYSDQKRNDNKKFTVIEDLKIALFQD